MDHSAFPDEYWEFFNPLDDDDAVTMDSAQHARAAAAVCLAVGTAIDADGPGPHGSIAGRKANMNREFDVGLLRMMTDDFNETPTYDDKMFARRFRMHRAVIDRIYKYVSARPEFVRKFDALGKPGLHPLQRVVAALRKLSFGVASDAVDEYVHISESSAHESLVIFCRAVCEPYGVEYGRQPTKDDLRRILKINAKSAFQAASVSSIASIGPGRPVRSSLPASLRARRRGRLSSSKLSQTGSAGFGTQRLATRVVSTTLIFST
jgi:hypothetical protein